MENSEFAQSTGYLRVVEKKILNTGSIDRVIDTPSGDEALRMLSQNSDYDFSSLERPEDYEIVLKDELKRLYKLCYGLSPYPDIVHILSCKYDYHNVKVAIKSVYLKKDMEYLFVEVTDTSPKLILDRIANPDSKGLPEHLITAIQTAQTVFKEKQDPQELDICVDKQYFAHMLHICEKLENEFMTKYVQFSIDFYNIKALFRIKNMQKGLRFLSDTLADGGLIQKELYVDNYDRPVEGIGENFYYKYFGEMIGQSLELYEKTGNFSALEKLADQYLLEHIKQSKYIAFGPENLFAYIVAKENEIRQVRILMTCKINHISNDILRERLRDNYA